MRQWRKLVVPVFVLAILAQILAPAACCPSMRADVSGGTPHCAMMAGAAGEHHTPSGKHPSTHQCCILCHLPQAVDPAPMAAAVEAPAPLTRHIAWTVDPALVPPAYTSEQARARAPPSFS